MKKIRIAVIGIGHLGTRHVKCLSALAPKVELVAVCDTKVRRTKKVAEHYGVPFVKDYRTLLGKVDAVDIVVPTFAHHDVAKFFLDHSVHVFVEKPIASTLDEADSLISTAQKHNLCLQVGHVERFNSAFQAITKFTRDPLFIECHRLNGFPNRSLDIGVVQDLMIHDLDIVLALNRCAVKNFHAVGINVLTDKEDISSVRLVFENGCTCNLTASRISDEVMRKIRIFTRKAYISLDYVKQEAFIYRKKGPLIMKHALPIEKEEPLKQELESFADSILRGKPPVVSGKAGRDALALALDIQQNMTDNRETVDRYYKKSAR
ncbi:MAG: Gfo/Idh/MocA family oxidoreductase [Candidatus Omnitrophota bacterium]